MTSLHVFCPKTVELPRLETLHSGHYWETGNGKYWIIYLRDSSHPLDVVEELTAAGLHVLPPFVSQKPLHADVTNALSMHGVISTDTSFDVAEKIAKASGMKHLRPHLY